MTTNAGAAAGPRPEPAPLADELIANARAAMEAFAGADQAALDTAARAVAWALYKPANARHLAELAVAETGLGDVESKVLKNQRKTFGALRDLLRAPTTGRIADDPATGITKYAKPVGVVCAVTPSTNPSATPVNKAMMAVNCGNPIIICPSPLAWPVTNATVELVRHELAKCGLPPDLVQVLPAPVSRAATEAVMRGSDLVVCTGSQTNVRAAYSSGTPAIGVGAGNVPVIVDETADLADAAKKIRMSKTFDNATSCSSENHIVVLDQVFDAAIEALEAEGGRLIRDPATRRRILDRLWADGKLNRDLIAKDPSQLAEVFDLSLRERDGRFFMLEETGIGPDYPLSGEKLSVVLTVYRARDFTEAKGIVRDILSHDGPGHSCGLHTTDPDRPDALARDTDVVRVLVNQAHTFGNGGGFDNGLPFTLSMGCGTWAGNSISENLNYTHFLNITHLVRRIPEDKPSEGDLFQPYWDTYGA